MTWPKIAFSLESCFTVEDRRCCDLCRFLHIFVRCCTVTNYDALTLVMCMIY